MRSTIGTGSGRRIRLSARGRDQEGDRVGDDGDRRGQRADQQPTETGPADLGDRGAGAQPAVGLDQVVPIDQLRQVGLVGDLEQHLADTEPEGDHEQVAEPEHFEQGQHGNQQQEHRLGEMGPDQQRPLPAAVDPDSGEHGEEQVRNGAEGTEHAHLSRRGVEQLNGDQGDGQQGDLGADR